jgi:hypothetical protein
MNSQDSATHALFAEIREKMGLLHRASGLAGRGQHPGTVGVVHALFEVSDLPAEHRVGLFAEPRVFDAWIRFSNGRNTTDQRPPDVHGMAIQVLDVPGNRAGGDPARSRVQDFLLVDHPVFFARDARHFLEFLQVKLHQAAAQPRGMTPAERGAWERQQAVELVGKFPVLAKFFSQPGNVLGAEYHSQTPYQFGPRAGRWFAKPLPVETPLPQGQDTPHKLSEALRASLAQPGFAMQFAFGIQLQTDLERMPLEDASDPWAGAPCITLATITIPAQDFTHSIPAHFAEALEFDPWHALVEHLPLGSINQVRRLAYEDSRIARRQARDIRDGQPIVNEELNLQTLRRFFDCFARRDALGMRTCLHPDVEFQDVGFHLHGDEVGAMWTMVTTAKHPAQVEHPIEVRVTKLSVTGNQGDAEWTCQYLLVPEGGGEPLPITNDVISQFRFADGLIVWQEDQCRSFWNWFRQVKPTMGPVLDWVHRIEELIEQGTGLDIPPDIEQRARQGVREMGRSKLDQFLVDNPVNRRRTTA